MMMVILPNDDSYDYNDAIYDDKYADNDDDNSADDPLPLMNSDPLRDFVWLQHCFRISSS